MMKSKVIIIDHIKIKEQKVKKVKSSQEYKVKSSS